MHEIKTIRAKGFALLTIFGALALSVGCRPGVQVPQDSQSPWNSTAFAPTSVFPTNGDNTAGALPVALPPDLTGSGDASPNPGTSILPPPQESLAKIEEMKQRFGMLGIRGSGATIEILIRAENAFARFPRATFSNLDISFEPAEAGGNSSPGGSGVWYGLNSAGGDEEGTTPPVSGQIRYFGDNLSIFTLVHEVAHHDTIFVAPNFGRQLVDSLGYELTPGTAGATGDNRVALNIGKFVPTNLTPNSVPTGYARENALEHIAELISLHLVPDETPPFGDSVPGFQMPSAVQTALDSRYGAIRAGSLTPGRIASESTGCGPRREAGGRHQYLAVFLREADLVQVE